MQQKFLAGSNTGCAAAGAASASTTWERRSMQSSCDIIGGRLTVNLENGKRRSVSLTADEAYDLMKYAQNRKRKRKKAKSLKQFDMIVCSMREGGMSVPSIAVKLGTSQASVEGAIRRLDSGRYGDLALCISKTRNR